MTLNIENAPASCRLGLGERECMYCPRTISKLAKHGTCPVCTKRWRQNFGEHWYAELWHVALVEQHLALHRGRDREVQLERAMNRTKEVVDEEKYAAAYAAIDAYCQIVFETTGKFPGRVTMAKELKRQAIIRIPSEATIQRRINAIRRELKPPVEQPLDPTIYDEVKLLYIGRLIKHLPLRISAAMDSTGLSMKDARRYLYHCRAETASMKNTSDVQEYLHRCRAAIEDKQTLEFVQEEVEAHCW
jgi:hypothetical protein